MELGASRSLDLLRLMQEALTNVFKHSRAGRVDVCLRREGDVLRLQIDDDGVGLATAAASSGAGMASMRLRARRLGGELDLLARADRAGTSLSVALPVVARAACPAVATT